MQPLSSIVISHAEKAHSFGARASSYTNGRLAYPEAIFNLLTQYIPSTASVLDLACGNGRSTIPLVSRFGQVRGCDFDTKMLDEARQNANRESTALEFDHGSAYNLSYQDKRFGLITIFSAFHWFCDEHAVKEMSRVLTDDGYIAVVTKGRSPSAVSIVASAKKILTSIIGQELPDPHENAHPIEMLTQGGFGIITDQNISYDESYNLEQFLDRIRSLSAWEYVVHADKEKEATLQLTDYFNGNKSQDGLLKATVNHRCIIVKKQN